MSWNVNSLRARLPRVLELLDERRPDVLCLQETKCAPDQLPREALAEAGWRVVDHSGGRWNGVAVVVPAAGPEPTDVVAGLAGEPVAADARWIEAVVGDLTVVSVYVPNGKDPGHPDYGVKLAFLEAMAARAGVLSRRGPLAIVGDVNVCPTDDDVWDPEAFAGHTHVTDAERAALQAVLDAGGLLDSHRALHGTGERAFTWWDYRAGSFHKDLGLRIDLAMLDHGTLARVHRMGVDRQYRKNGPGGAKPSDHAPLVVDLDAPGVPEADWPVGDEAAPGPA